MEIAWKIVVVLYFLAWIIAVLVAIRSWVGMHNNTNDGNTFKLLTPVFMLEDSDFNEKGKAWRTMHLKADAFCIFLFIIWCIYAFDT